MNTDQLILGIFALIGMATTLVLLALVISWAGLGLVRLVRAELRDLATERQLRGLTRPRTGAE